MFGKIIAKKFSRILAGSCKQSFQLCPKRPSHFYFSQFKNNPNDKDPKNPSQENPQPETSHRSKARTARQRLIELKEQKRQQEYQKKLEDINITTGSFNSIVAYLLLEKHKWFYIFLGGFITLLLLAEDSPFCYKTMGVVQDPFTGNKKFMVVNQYRENTLQKMMIGILEKQLQFWTQNYINGGLSQVDRALQNKLQAALANLNARYGIEFKRFSKQQVNYQIADSGQNIVASVLGQEKLIVSTRLLRLSPQSLENIIFLIHALHSRYLHVQNVSFWERMNLQESSQTSNIIKVEKTFISNAYSIQGIQETIELMAKKYSQNEQEYNAMRQAVWKALKEVFAVKSSSKSLPEFDLRNRLKKASEFFV